MILTEYRKLICKLRISDHSIEIERGRYRKIPRNERICKKKKCKIIDDEFHLFFNCSINEKKILVNFRISKKSEN